MDLLWLILVLLGVKRLRIVPGATAFNALVFESYPWTHSLLMGIVWGMALGLVARWRGIGGSAALLIGTLVVSHWVLDFVTHVPDLPLWPGPSPHVGLGLWNSIPGTLIVESALWIGGIAIYLHTRPLHGALPPVAFWSLVAVSMLLWAISP